MSARGTRAFPPAGIRGKQGNDGPPGPSYSISSIVTGSTALINGSNTITLSSGLPSSGTIKFWGNLNISGSSATRVVVTPIIDGVELTEYKCTVYIIDPGGAINVCLMGLAAVAQGNTFEVKIGISLGTGTLDGATTFYAIE